MPSPITPRTLATATTTTITAPQTQPYETDTDIIDPTIDLDATTANERGVALTLVWENVEGAAQRLPQLRTAIEASDATTGPWSRVAEFDPVNLDQQIAGSQSIGFVSPARYIRARTLLAARGTPNKRSARFGIIGSKS